ncbi:MAG: toprim domain-containing protein [Burkholderiaceae bacterium]|nr:toprim domain-containing protein [Burkholderiaceae bacterium]
MDYRVKRSLHRTWVCGDGTKAPIDTPRLLLAGHAKAGAVCRLWPDEAVTMGLGVAEGIETALSLAHAFCPVWATVDASGLAALPVLAGVESLTIGADNDPAGIKAATTCADRWAAAGREVRIVKPREHKKDLNDLAVTA